MAREPVSDNPIKTASCKCCGSNARATSVLASRIGPYSFSYCDDCAENVDEPAEMVNTMVRAVGGVENFLGWKPFGSSAAIADQVNVFRDGAYIPARLWLSEAQPQ